MTASLATVSYIGATILFILSLVSGLCESAQIFVSWTHGAEAFHVHTVAFYHQCCVVAGMDSDW